MNSTSVAKSESMKLMMEASLKPKIRKCSLKKNCIVILKIVRVLEKMESSLRETIDKMCAVEDVLKTFVLEDEKDIKQLKVLRLRVSMDTFECISNRAHINNTINQLAAILNRLLVIQRKLDNLPDCEKKTEIFKTLKRKLKKSVADNWSEKF